MDTTGEKKKIREIVLKPYTLSELARMYGMSRFTFRKYLRKIANLGERQMGNFYSVAQVRIIFEHFDIPGILSQDDFQVGEIDKK